MAAPPPRYLLLVPVALLVSVLAFPAAPLAQVAILHTVDRTSASTIHDRARAICRPTSSMPTASERPNRRWRSSTSWA
jgi:hypothetical protein